MTERRPRWLVILLILVGVAMAVVLMMQGVGRWAYARGIGGLLEISGSQDADVYSKNGQRYFEQHQYKVAEEFARAALNRAPLHQKAMRTLGMAQVAQGREEQGRRTMEAAGRLGWQDVATQTWLMWDSLQRGNTQAGLLRADALARRGTMASGLFKVFITFASAPESRRMLMQRLQIASGWRPDFFRFSDAATLPEAQTAEGLLRDLRKGPWPPAREEVVPIVRRLVVLGAYDRAANLSRDMLGEPRTNASNPVGDGDFKRFDVYAERPLYRTPFDWEFGVHPGATAVVERPDSPEDGALYVESNGAKTVMLARKVVRIAPGARQLAFTIRSSDAGAIERFRWSVTCLETGQQLIQGAMLAPATNVASQRGLAFTVPADCRFQQLQLSSAEAPQRQTLSAYLDNVAIS
ncbi:MAG TPA: hypothetical protein VF589_11615 [Allosphingosinicella sp.]|jgi:hypothetical protein